MHISTYQKNIYILKYFKSQSLKKKSNKITRGASGPPEKNNKSKHCYALHPFLNPNWYLERVELK